MLIVGHRGVGKTTFLSELKELGETVDLDQEVAHLFPELKENLMAKGESYFRRCEVEALELVLARSPAPQFVALGAGFQGPIPKGSHVLWLRRTTDRLGRSFLNRPRLNSSQTPLEEYLTRFHERDQRFRTWSHEELVLPEGKTEGLDIFFKSEPILIGDLTLLPENFRNWVEFVNKRLKWGVRRFELRDDLLNQEQMVLARNAIPKEQILFSCRSKAHAPCVGETVDWALELGDPPSGIAVDIVSLHQRESDFAQTLKKLKSGRVLKLAVEINNFSELEAGHKWWLQDPGSRCFLPRSADGRWQWYRILFGPQMPLHFFREGDGSVLDQPFFWQMTKMPKLKHSFAAVLGAPVDHSRTPTMHLNFFAERQRPIVAIPIGREEFLEAWPVLVRVGLDHAAITSPLKEECLSVTTRLTLQAKEIQSINTVAIKGGEVIGHNTDVLALQEIASEIGEHQSVWLWGGGGVKPSVLKAWPSAKVISARQGTNDNIPPELLIWAVPRSRHVGFPRVCPKQILDLNYGDDSPGLEFATQEKIPYQSGLKMFTIQALKQQEFWSSL